jgi:hypothetical protein
MILVTTHPNPEGCPNFVVDRFDDASDNNNLLQQITTTVSSRRSTTPKGTPKPGEKKT